jgi:tyrosyl-tRNA synthetase
MNFIEEMRERGLVAQITHEEELREHVASGVRSAYVGMDPTAPSLHVGHLLPIMTMARWQRAGHRAVALMGGGTVLIGDPTGKTEMRKLLGDEEINANIQNFKRLVQGILDFKSDAKGIIVNNADWIRPLNYIDFLREIGSQFSVNKMLTAECFKSRLETGLSFIEFNYMLLQSYDFLHLYRTQKCTVQLGGDDQWSNILAGMDLIRRLERKQDAYCMTTPLLTTADGKKMGKTEKGAVWIDANLTSPYEYFQFWRNVPDGMLGPCLRYFTFMPVSDIRTLEGYKDQKINEAKLELAREATAIIHGEEEARKALDTAAKLFGGAKGGPGGEQGSDGNEPVFYIDRGRFGQGLNIIDVLVDSQMFATKSEAKRLIEQGGLTLNGVKVADFTHHVTIKVIDSPGGALVKKGKKHYYRLRFSG